MKQTGEMNWLIVRFLPLAILVLSYTSEVCFGQSAKQPRIMDYFQKKQDVISYAVFGAGAPPSKELLDLLQSQVAWDRATPEPTNPLGMRLRFVKIDDDAKGTAPARYRVFADGAPENKVFSFGAWPISKEIVHDSALISANAGVSGSNDVYVNARGLVMNHKPKPEEVRSSRLADELEVAPSAAKGEPIRYMLDSLDEELQIVGTLVPHPVEAEDEGCRIEVRIAQPDAEAVLIFVDGIPAKSRIPVVLQSANGAVTQVVIADADGRAVLAGFPHVPNKTQGILKVTAEGTSCLPSVELPWGTTGEPAAKTQ
jgi:hypothetical protein